MRTILTAVFYVLLPSKTPREATPAGEKAQDILIRLEDFLDDACENVNRRRARIDPMEQDP